MAAAALRSAAVGLALRPAAAPATRLSSASAITRVRTMHSGGGQDGAAKLKWHWTDVCFGAVATAGTAVIGFLMFAGGQQADWERGRTIQTEMMRDRNSAGSVAGADRGV